jgi:hypothetical protein
MPRLLIENLHLEEPYESRFTAESGEQGWKLPAYRTEPTPAVKILEKAINIRPLTIHIKI